MRAVLLSPPTSFGRTLMFPSAGLAALSQRLELAGIDHVCLDGNLLPEAPIATLRGAGRAQESAYLGCLIARAEEYQPDVIGISAWGVSVPFALTFARAYRAAHPETPIVCGGHRDPDLAKLMVEAEPAISAVAVADGEEVVVPLFRWAMSGGKGPCPAGVVYRHGQAAVLSAPPELVPPFRWPMPSYRRFVFQPGSHFLFEGSRGCPHRCAFCCVNQEPFRRLPPAELARRLSAFCAAQPTEVVSFSDNFVPLTGAWIEAVADSIRQWRLGLRWMCSTRADHISLPTVARMASAGCSSLFVGLESVSPDTLLSIRKTTQPEAYCRHVLGDFLAIEEMGVKLRVSTIVGFPHEGIDDMRRTLDFVLRLLDHGILAYTGLPIVYPGSEMWRMYRSGQLDLVPVEDDSLLRNHGGLFASRFSHSPWLVPNAFMPKHLFLDQEEIERVVREYLARIALATERLRRTAGRASSARTS